VPAVAPAEVWCLLTCGCCACRSAKLRVRVGPAEVSCPLTCRPDLLICSAGTESRALICRTAGLPDAQADRLDAPVHLLRWPPRIAPPPAARRPPPAARRPPPAARRPAALAELRSRRTPAHRSRWSAALAGLPRWPAGTRPPACRTYYLHDPHAAPSGSLPVLCPTTRDLCCAPRLAARAAPSNPRPAARAVPNDPRPATRVAPNDPPHRPRPAGCCVCSQPGGFDPLAGDLLASRT
jgi:hypothetical protein